MQIALLSPRLMAVTLVSAYVLASSSASAVSDSKVEVVSAGEGETFTLRLAPKKGAKQTVVTTVAIETTQMMGEIAIPSDRIPQVRLVQKLKVTQIKNGEVTYSFKIKEATFEKPDETTEALSKALTKISGTAVVSKNGHTQDVQLAGADGKAANIVREALRSTHVPLPEEAVAVGATWRAKPKATKDGKVMDGDTITYKLVSADAKGCTIQQMGGEDDKDRADIRINFAAVAPTAGEVEQHFTAKEESDDEDMSLTMKTRLIFSSL